MLNWRKGQIWAVPAIKVSNSKIVPSRLSRVTKSEVNSVWTEIELVDFMPVLVIYMFGKDLIKNEPAILETVFRDLTRSAPKP